MTGTDLWRSLPSPWRGCVEEAWDAYRAGSLPIGAVVVDPSGAIVSRGRNRIHDPSGDPGTLFGHKLSHAEMNALVAFDYSRNKAAELTLFTTTEPCPLCVGAVRMSDVKGVAYAARDPWAGSAAMFDSVPYLKRGLVDVSGPDNGLLENVLVAMQVEYFLRSGPAILDRFLARYGEVLPQATRAGHSLFRTGMLATLAATDEGPALAVKATATLLENAR